MEPPDPVPPPSADAPPGEPGPARARAPRRPWAWALAAGLAAGLVSWSACEALREIYKEALTARINPSVPTDQVARQVERMEAMRIGHATATYGLLGALLGAALGIAGGLARGGAARIAAGALAGLLAGGAAGAFACMGVLPIHNRHFEPLADSLVLALVTHGAIWAAIGAAAGLAFGIGLGGAATSIKALLGGLLGAVAATMLYEVAGGMLFPLDKTSQPLSATWGTRLLAQVLLAVLVAAGAATCVTPREAASAPAE